MSRKRQFQDVRQSRMETKTVFSMTSTQFDKNYKGGKQIQACYNCVNKIIAQNKRRNEKRQKRRNEMEEKRRIQQLNAIKLGPSPQQILQRQAMMQNQHLIKQNQLKKKTQKQKALVQIEKMHQTQSLLDSRRRQFQEQQKQKMVNYQQQLLLQMKQQKVKKQEQKRLQNERVIIPTVQFSKSYDQIGYRKQLEKQIAQKKDKEKRERQQKIRQQKELINRYNQFEDDGQRKLNPEISIQLSKIQAKRKEDAFKKRKQGQQERKKMDQQDAQLFAKIIKNKMAIMHDYVRDLTQQVNEKEKRKIQEHHKDQLQGQNNYINLGCRQFQNCQECNTDVPIQYITKLPPLQ